jgi:hypothetical protein
MVKSFGVQGLWLRVLCLGITVKTFDFRVEEQDFRWAILLRRDGGLRAPTRRAPETLVAPAAAWRRKFPEELRRFQLSLNRDGSLVFSARRAWRSG